MTNKPGLFGINNSNRDFTVKENWGKNQFNSSFPASLALYIESKNIDNNYITLDEDLKIVHSTLSTKKLFNVKRTDDNTFFAFENVFSPYQKYVLGSLPRVDLVIQDLKTGNCLSGIEIKLTALPDNSTCELRENEYGSELVVRPDTIVYLACSIMQNYDNNFSSLSSFFDNTPQKIKDWSETENVIPFIPNIVKSIENILKQLTDKQTPLVMQPIWKTNGKSPMLADNCLDNFVWSNISFVKLFLDAAKTEKTIKKINRQIRTLIWLYKMLYEFSQKGQFDHSKIIDELSFNTKNDKAFAVNGSVTNQYIKSKYLTKPRITKKEIKKIILGGGQSLLSPERRFDAIIYNSPELFK
ncbi:MAG: HindVP family restriction endonuclease [Bacteroidota bacterium]|nr:HindVP family restriction endonuclease [Bacteroidota bacterium]